MRNSHRRAGFLLAGTLPVFSACSSHEDAGRERVGISRDALQGPNGINANLVFDSEWSQGYCARVVVENQHPQATTGTWSVELDLGAATTFVTWDGMFSGNTGLVTTTPQPHNAAIAPSASTQFGFCASIPTPGLRAVLLSVDSDLPPTTGVVVAEYKFDETLDPMVSPDFPTELWASVHRPEPLEPGRQYPLLVFMHGNHATCGTGENPRVDDNNQYALTGSCPEDYVVVPNHRGFDYLAQDLVPRGYIVVSINTNRGINIQTGMAPDTSVIGPRGRLLLRHLERLSRWDSGSEATPPELGVDLQNRIDFDQVGLLGHSRGGEGVRFAYNEYRRSGSPWPALIESPVSFRGVFEIGPTDEGIGGDFFEADDTPWNVIVPACDADVGTGDPIRVFDRMLNIPEPEPLFKSFYHVWGANHNFYNSEWQQSDAGSGGTGCINHEPLFDPLAIGSPEQRETGRFAAAAFFTANVGTERDEPANALFDPAFPFPAVPYRVSRGYHPGSDAVGGEVSLRLEDFINPTGTSSYGLPNETSGTISVQHITQNNQHDPSLGIGLIQDIVPSASTFFQSNFAAPGDGFDLTEYDFLDLRADRAVLSQLDPTVVSFLVQLVNADDSLSSAVSIDQFLELGAPPRGAPTLPTARIPLSQFTGATLDAVRAVRLGFTTPVNGAGVFVASIRATKLTTEATPPMTLAGAPPSRRSRLGAPLGSPEAVELIGAGNTIESVELDGADVVLTLRSRRHFRLGGSKPLLSLGTEQSTVARHPNGDLYTIQFVVPRTAFERLDRRVPLQVSQGAGARVVWDFGELDTSTLRR